MKDEQKWTLSSGKKVEGVLFNFGLKCHFEQYVKRIKAKMQRECLTDTRLLLDSMAHSFIVDTTDATLKKEFTAAEIAEIRELNAHPLPPMSRAST